MTLDAPEKPKLSPEERKLKAQIAQCKGSLTKTENFLRKQQEGSLEKEAIKTRLQQLDSVLATHKDLSLQLHLLSEENEESDFSDDDFEDRCLTLMSDLRKLLKTQEPAEVYDSSSAMKLPHIDIPVFDGKDVMKYKTFIELFSAVIDKNNKLAPIQKLFYLRKFLKGEPLSLIEGLPVTGDSYCKALELLSNRYDNKFLVITNHVQALLDFPAISKGVSSNLRELVSNSRQHLAALETLGQSPQHWDMLLLPILLRKVDQYTCRAYHSERVSKELPTLEDFFAFLERRACSFEVSQQSEGGGWLLAAALHALVALSAAGHNRRSTPTQATLPVTKGGWRPVIGSSGLVYGAFGTAPLHAPPAYKIPLEQYASSPRPLATRDATKLTSIAQSYRPTTLRTVPSSQAPLNQPINTYHNPFANGLTHYKYVQNFPVESVLIRNPHNPYAARPVFKYPQKLKQPIHNYQHLPNIQPVQFAYQTGKPFDAFSKPADQKPENKKPQQQNSGSETEIFKPEVYKLPDNDVAQQSLNQQVKTAQQQNIPAQNFQNHNFPAQIFPTQTFAHNSYGQKIPVNPYSHYTFTDNSFPPRIFGNFGPFNVQPVKGRDPGFPTRTTYVPQQPTRQTVFNSFNYSPSYKPSPSQFPSTTPKLQTTANHIHFGTAVTDYSNNVPTQAPKVSTPPKIDPNAGHKGFKASPQDPFSKLHQNSNYNKVTTYNPVQTTTLATHYNDYHYPAQQNFQAQNYYDQQTVNLNYEKKKQKIHDSFAAGGNQVVSQQYIHSPSNLDGIPNSVPYKATYEVTETDSDEHSTYSSKAPWTVTPVSYDLSSYKPAQESVTQQEYFDSAFKPETTPLPEVAEEFAIVTEADKGYENSLLYNGNAESQSRRPLGDDFEPIVQHKLKDYYYKVTPTYDEHSAPKRKKKPTEAYKETTQAATTSSSTTLANEENNELLVEPLPTLPPNKHFRRPSTPPPTEKDKARKRIKHRRRRPPLANINNNREETSTAKYVQSSTDPSPTTEGEDYRSYTRRPTKYKGQPNLTTPSVSDDLTTSALPTISPTYPTIAKKKLGHRRPLTTTTERYETTTQSFRDYDSNKESPIMKIATRPQFPKQTSSPYEIKSETPDYSHKQDEKDTPTSDISVSLSDTLKTRPDKNFSFHRDVKPIEAELVPIKSHRETTTQSIKDSSEVANEISTTSPVETTSETSTKVQRPRLKNKYESNRPRFSVKDYRNRLSSTTSTTEKSAESHAPKVRFPQRRPYNENRFNSENETATERKKFTPKDPRHKVVNSTEINDQGEKEIHSVRQSSRVRQTTVDTTEGTTQKTSSRIRNGSRRPRPTTEDATDTTSPTTVHSKRPLRKKIKDSDISESVQDISVTETTTINDHRDDTTSERARSESAIMKIADKKHHDPVEHLFEHSKRVSDLTLAASKDYNTPGMFKTVSQSSRRVPNYFTIATDDPILPIEAFFPQLNQKKE